MSHPSTGNGRNRKRARAGQPLGLERLEDRTLLSAADTANILVLFRGSAGLDWSSLASVPDTTIVRPLDIVSGLYEVHLGAGVSVGQALAEYRAEGTVLDAEPDATVGIARIPDDPKFGLQWDMRNTGQGGGTKGADVNATAAWDVTTGSYQTTVAVIDTGIDYNHPDLYQNIWINQAEIPKSRLKNLIDVDHDGIISFRDLNDPRNQGPGKITDINHDGRIDAADILAPMVLDQNGNDTGQGGWAYPGNTQDGDTAHPNDFIGWNFVNNTNNPFDDNGHGTHVSGTIGAQGDNGVGVAGINWTVSLMAVKFIDASGSGQEVALLDALAYSIRHGAKISNNSWTGFGDSPLVYDAIQSAQKAGQIFVAAAGNDGSNNDTNPTYPASFPLDNIVSVAATTNQDQLAGFSNYGAASVDLAAPGVNILSTTPNDTYTIYTGTSMATSHVTGALALVWSEHPTWTYKQVIAQVENTVTKVAALQGKTVTGGVLNVGAAVGANSTNNSDGPTVISVTGEGLSSGSLTGIRLVFDKTIDIPSLRAAGSVTLTGPGGQAVPVTAINIIPGTTDRQFEVVFAAQTTPGNYVLALSSTIKGRQENHLAAYQTTLQLTAKGQTTGKAQTTFTNGTATDIPDVGTAVSSVSVTNDFVITSASVKLNISHTYDGDLYIHLQAPDGTDVLLSNRNGGSGHNYTDTVFDDRAKVSIRHGAAPFTGAYTPEGSLAVLTGKHAKGTWRLWVEDRAVGDNGALLNWTLTFNSSAVPSGKATTTAAGTTVKDPKHSRSGPTPSDGAARIAIPSDGSPYAVPLAWSAPRTSTVTAGDSLFASPSGLARVVEDHRLGGPERKKGPAG